MAPPRQLSIAAGAALALAAGGLGGAAAFGGDDGGEDARGPEAERARRAALALFPGSRVNSIERDSEDGATWEVEIARGDGSTADVRLDRA